MDRVILHIDFDSFFASVEQEANPFFRNKPMGVTATNGRSCIIASSREAKALGIGTGSRVYDAQKICPDIALAPADFVKYWEISKKFIRICNDFSPFVEVFSIDELFMDITLTAKLFGGADGLIARLKKRIAKEVGEYITVSVGISHNKLLAKLASGLKKPNGVVAIKPSQVESIYKIAELTDICGIGERIKIRLNAMGIYTLTHLRRTPLHALVAEFGNVEGQFLKNVGLGVDTVAVKPFTQAEDVKSVGRNYCLPQNQYDKRIVLQNVYELCEEVCIKLRRLNRKARAFGMFLRGTEVIHGHITQQHYSYLASDMFAVCQILIGRHADSFHEGYTRQIGVWAGYLENTDYLSLPLLPDEIRLNTLAKITDSINARYGTHTVRNGFLLYAHKLTTVPNGFMADRYERSKLGELAQ